MLGRFGRTLGLVSKVSAAQAVWQANVLEKSRMGGASPAFGMLGLFGQVQWGFKVKGVIEVAKWLECDYTWVLGHVGCGLWKTAASYRDVSPSIIPRLIVTFAFRHCHTPAYRLPLTSVALSITAVMLSKMGQVGLRSPSPHSCCELVIGHATHHLRDVSCITRGILPRSRYAIECRLPDRMSSSTTTISYCSPSSCESIAPSSSSRTSSSSRSC